MRNRHFYALGFGALMVFDTLTQVSIKLASVPAGAVMMESQWLLAVSLNPWLYAAVAGYLGAFVTWMTLLKRAPIGSAFAASHLGLVPILAVSATYFGEQLTAMQVVGALGIVLGIVLLSLSEAKQAHG